MLGAIAGDMIGSLYEARPIKRRDFPLFGRRSRFTDDSVLTAAVARAILQGEDYRWAVWSLGRRYPDAGYGGSFIKWLAGSDPRPYGSFGNGAAMRVSPVGFAFGDAGTVLHEAERQAAISHDHPEGIKGAQAVALAVFLARTGADREHIRRELARRASNRVGHLMMQGHCDKAQALYRKLRTVSAHRPSRQHFSSDWCPRP